MRLDELLVQRELCADLHDARASIMAGEVVVGEHRATSAGMRVTDDTAVRLKEGKRRGGFVSRGGLKLQRALDAFAIDVTGLSCVDLGASSGGFTDCLLQRGAAHVSAVDVGAGQFDWGLRNDTRVSLFERTHIRNVTADDIGGPFDLAVADLSFISLTSVMDDVASFLRPGASFVSLIKPQFEANRGLIEPGGVVRDAEVHASCIRSVFESACSCGFEVLALTYSLVKGPAGNIEFLFWAKNHGTASRQEGSMCFDEIERVVAEAHAELKGDS